MSRDIAIIGMQCVLPGASNLAQYWDNLVDGVDVIREVPPGRLNGMGQLRRPQEASRRGGFLPDSFRFDPLRFNIMPTIVPEGDPDQFLMLHVIGAALGDAAIAEDHPARRRTDVIIGRGGYITNKMSEIYFSSDLVHHLLQYLQAHGAAFGDRDGLQRLARDLLASLPAGEVDTITTCIPNLVASRTANRLNLRGAAYTVDAACASSLVAVEQAMNRLRQGQCDVAVAAGIFLCQTPTFWSIFTQLGAMSPTQQIRPFDRHADGLLVGEGAGAVVLKRLEDARRDGDQVYAILKGAGIASDGRDAHILASSSNGQVQALKNAYDDAQVDPATIGYLEAHGTGTVVGDLAEVQTIHAFYGARGRFPPSRAMGSVKSMIGHTMPAAGIASLIKTALCLSNKCLPPSLHCQEPRPELHDLPFYINRETRPWIQSPTLGPRRAGINAFGFGGINAHLVLEEARMSASSSASPVRCRPYRTGGKRPSELIVVSAASREGLLARLQRVESYLARFAASSGPAKQGQNGHARNPFEGRSRPSRQPPEPPKLQDIAWTLAEEVDHSQPCKLAMVCSDLDQLRSLLAACITGLRQQPPRVPRLEEIYFSESAAQPAGSLAAIFPGVGFPGLIGNYPAHLMELCRLFPEVRELFDQVDLRDEHPDDPIPTSLIFFPPSSFTDDLQLQLRNRIAAMKVVEDAGDRAIEIEPCQRNIAASGVTLSNWVSWLVLRGLQVPVEMACGQSQGEIAALCATGILDFNEVVPRFWQALAVSPDYAARGRLAFIGASEEKLAPYLAEVPDTSVAIHIAPEMLIIGGSDTHIMDLTRRLRQQGLIANPLPYPPIHTPRLAHMRDELKRIIDMDLAFRSPQFTLYSAITENPFPEGADRIRELAMGNLDRPVRFWQTIHRMYADGARVFVQVGGGTLASNIKTILPRPDVVGTAVDVDHRHPLTQLHHLCAVLLTSGLRCDLACLHRHGDPRRLDLDAPPAASDSHRLLLPLRMDWVPLPAPVPGPEGDASAAATGIAPRAAAGASFAHRNAPAVEDREASSEGIAAVFTSTPTGLSPSSPERFDPRWNEESGDGDVAGTCQNSNISGTHGSEPFDTEPQSLAPSATEAAVEPRADCADELAEATPAAVDPEPASAMPLVGRIVSLVPEHEVVTERMLDLDEDLFLHDHVLIGEDSGKALEHRMPILPMTMILEAAAETAACVAPGRGLIGFERITAHRWIDFRDSRTLALGVKARLDSIDPETGVRRIQAEIFSNGRPSASAVVLFHDAYREDIQLQFTELRNPQPWPLTAEDIYTERHMFHGPLFRCVSGMHVLGEQGLEAEITVGAKDRLFASLSDPLLLVDPVVLDGVAQLVAMFAIANGYFLMPAKITKLEFYGTAPPPGTRVPIRIEVRDMNPGGRTVVADAEVGDGSGGVWFRFEGINEWLYDYGPQLQDTQRLPRRYHLARAMPLDGLPAETMVMTVSRADLRHANIEWLARLFLHQDEWLHFDQLATLQKKWQFLMGRIAVKDVVRIYLATRMGTEMVHPAVLLVAADEAGRPWVCPLEGFPAMPQVSISHTDDCAVAMASEVDCGVDVEPLTRDVRAVLASFTGRSELDLIEPVDAHQPDAYWPTRLWCAKEAVAKLIGTGLRGRPAEFEAVDLEPEGAILIRHRVTARTFAVQTSQSDNVIVAYTTAAEAGPEVQPAREIGIV